MAREQARVGVDQISTAWQLSHAPREKLTERNDDTEIGREGLEGGDGLGSADFFGLEDGNPACESTRRDRRLGALAAAAAPAFRLGDRRHDLVRTGGDALEGRNGEVRRTKKQDAEGSTQGRFTGGAGARSPVRGQESSSALWSFLRFCT